MPALTLESFKAAPPVLAHEIHTPEFGEGATAWIAELTAAERESRVESPWRKYKELTGQDGSLRAFLVAACLCNDAGRNFMCPEHRLGAFAEELAQLPIKTFDRLYHACENVNGLGEAAQAALEKN